MTNTLNDMSVDELESLAARVSATVQQKREEDEKKNVVQVEAYKRLYTFNLKTKKLTQAPKYLHSDAYPSVFQGTFDAFFEKSRSAKTDCNTLATIFTAIAKAL